MPQSAPNSAVETEKGFGTGLRAQLSRRRGDSDDFDTEPKDDIEIVDVGDPSHGFDPDSLQSELASALEREASLRVSLAEQAEAYDLALAELEEREQVAALAVRDAEEQARRLEAETARIETERIELAARAAEPPGESESAREYLRRRLEENGERVWNAFESALEATRADGAPDFRTRLTAATALLAEAYAAPETSPQPAFALEPSEPAQDELAVLRATKTVQPLP